MAETLGSQETLRLPTHRVLASSFIDPSSEDALHELRVRIPVELHRQLLSIKILRGKSLAESVMVALDRYFAEQERQALSGLTA